MATTKTTTKKATVKKSPAKKPAAKKVIKSIRDNKVYGNQAAYVLDCIYDSYMDYGGKKRPTDKDLINFAIDRFNKEYNHEYNKRRIPNIQKRIGEWLSGLPFGIDYTYEDIIKQGKKWGYCKTQKQEDQFIDRWFDVLGYHMMQIWEYYNKPKSIYEKLR